MGFPLVADAATGLVWQGCAVGEAGADCAGSALDATWQDALDYCQDSTWAGFTDWYLPNVIELRSIVDDRRSAPSLEPDAFPGAVSLLWSSTSCAGYWDRAWFVDFVLGGVSNEDKRGILGPGIRCVRQGP